MGDACDRLSKGVVDSFFFLGDSTVVTVAEEVTPSTDAREDKEDDSMEEEGERRNAGGFG